MLYTFKSQKRDVPKQISSAKHTGNTGDGGVPGFEFATPLSVSELSLGTMIMEMGRCGFKTKDIGV